MSEYCYEEAVRDAEETSQGIVNGRDGVWQDKPLHTGNSNMWVSLTAPTFVVTPNIETVWPTSPLGQRYEAERILPRNLDIPLGIGGAPTRASNLPTDPQERKRYPVASGVLDYFPDAIVALANLSWQGNEQHNPGQPLHWARGKSTDEADTAIRHFLQRGTLDTDGQRHTAKFVWRGLALLQKEIEAEQLAEEK